jgi:hypothetical protein
VSGLFPFPFKAILDKDCRKYEISDVNRVGKWKTFLGHGLGHRKWFLATD